MYFIFLFSFLLGAIIGSFLNVVAYRYNTGKTIGGRSQCFYCGHILRPVELVPIFSFLAQKGKCKNCKSAISIQYPLVEIATGTLFALGMAKFFPLINTNPDQFFVSLLLYFIAVSILVVIFVYDIRHKIIPDGLSIAFAAVSLVYLVSTSGAALFTSTIGILNLLIGPLMALGIFALWYVSKGAWIGLGDAKLVIGIGWLLGFVHAISAVIIAFWIGALFSIVLLTLAKARRTKKKHFSNVGLKTEIPFAPFLIIGLLLVFFYQWDVMFLQDLISLL